MQTANSPFGLPQNLDPDNDRVLSHWQLLERGEAEMPFWDDVTLSALPDLIGRLVLIEVLERPLRFRFAFAEVGAEIARRYGGDLGGRFLDEIEARDPIQLLSAQSSATVETRTPSYYRHDSASPAKGFSRLVLPMWGGGHVAMLLVSFAFD